VEKITARHIVNLLAKRHDKDVFLSEVGVRENSQRMDAWALKASYASMGATGYEIKVSYADFANDEKWRTYLKYCTRFYFVCPSGLIRPEELPDDTGLLWVAKTGSRLMRKKLAPFRDIHIPEEFWMSLLFNKLVPGSQLTYANQTAYWKEWLTQKKEKAHLGQNVSKRLRAVIEERIDKVGEFNRKLDYENKGLTWIKSILAELEITDANSWGLRKGSVKRRLEAFLGGIPSNLDVDITNVIAMLKKVQTSICDK